MTALAAHRPLRFPPGSARPPAPRAAPTPRTPHRLTDLRRHALLVARLRVLLIGGAFLLIAAAALMRIAWLGVIQPPSASSTMAELLLPPRGEITDRNGVPLARAFPAYALWYNPQALGDGGTPLVKPPQQVAAALKAIFPELDEQAIARRLAAGRPGYLRRRVLPEDANRGKRHR